MGGTEMILLLLAIGLCAGVLSGLFGIGGGVVIVPALVYIMGFSMHRAIGTSLAVLLPPVGLIAFLEYYRHHNVNVRAALLIAATLIIGAWLGALTANRLPAPVLRLLFGVLVVVLGGYMVADAVKRLGWI
ncbi:MAG TPA: sulfite exporter TauE/SafE family protein [Deltaproteobacteria bacterium]|nr:sulfite exporter TauE/SafE family protein [Deltaproteobacteria bacterium]HRW80331.1 sulfite exporter TauE/SafE family protein [Desulfomonilia bacterium]HNS89231.1 sulfite exporter TauE/SafE family protein [Deltaproteobacteria bacterium]HOA44564.1 sulfite exporter TauE/SafE family protein [Deltaproteobacteria bacterium]HOC76703.1 sulfite exporter TauE/SafE family protein [Deltaproteobacteria bacterium]